MRKILAALRNANWLQVLGYVAVFVVLFIVFLYLTFPFDTVRDSLIKRLEASGNLDISVEKLGPFRLSGFRATGVKVASAMDTRQVYLQVDELRVRLRPSQLLRNRLWVDFDVYAYGGGLAGSYCKRGTVNEVALNFVGLDLQKYGVRDVARQYGSLDLAGLLSGQFELHFARGKRGDNNGLFNLNIDQLRVANIKILNNTLPDMTFEPGRIAMKLQAQTFQVEEVVLKGNQVELGLTGRINLADTFKGTRFYLNLLFKPSEAIEEALGVVMMALKEPDENGFYQININGSPGNLSTRN